MRSVGVRGIYKVSNLAFMGEFDAKIHFANSDFGNRSFARQRTKIGDETKHLSHTHEQPYRETVQRVHSPNSLMTTV